MLMNGSQHLANLRVQGRSYPIDQQDVRMVLRRRGGRGECRADAKRNANQISESAEAFLLHGNVPFVYA